MSRYWPWIARISLLALLGLCIAWEMWIAPVRPGGSLFVLKALPLMFAVRGIWRGDSYTMQWLSMLVLLYFAEGAVCASSGASATQVLGMIETTLSVLLFVSLLAILGPQKKAARAPRTKVP